MASRTYPSAPDDRDDLDLLLEDLVATFNQQELPRYLLRAAGVVLIQRLAEPGEREHRVALWQERWRETVRLEAIPLRKPGPG